MDHTGGAETLQATLAALRAHREKIDRAISALEEIAGNVPTSGPVDNGRPGVPEKIMHDTFTGSNITDASAQYLAMVGRPARSTAEITEALNRGGLKVTEASVESVLGRIHRAHGPVQRASRGTWGLPEWYPSRRSGAPAKKRASEDGAEPVKSEKTEEASEGAS